jgi:opacity protein-like surface antigen
MRKVLLGVSIVVVLVAAPAPARAQGYFAPSVGYDFSGDAGNCPSLLSDCKEKKVNYGLAAGALMGGIFGFEEDLGYAPNFFGESPSFGSNSLLTLMSNIVVGLPLPGIRPYASGGLGLMRTHVSFSQASLGADTSQNAFAYDIGGGVMLLFPHHLGLRGDYRHFHSAQDISILGISIANTKLSFSRVSVGLVLH